jgi:hypothetical protein
LDLLGLVDDHGLIGDDEFRDDRVILRRDGYYPGAVLWLSRRLWLALHQPLVSLFGVLNFGVEEWKEMAPILDQLNGARSLPPDKRSQEITTIVDGQLSRIHRMMCHLSDRFAATHAGSLAVRIISLLKGIVKIKALRRPAFGEDGQAVFLESWAPFVRELDPRLGANAIDMDYLFRLFSSNEGAGIVWKIMSDRAEKVVFGDP